MSLSQTLARRVNVSTRFALVQMKGQQRRNGGSLNKNKNIEVWNGGRENCDREFAFNASNMGKFLLGTVLPAAIVYHFVMEEQIKHDQIEGKPFNPRRYL
ncbi:hypothetical protein H257_11772 [Aphanomyces astaci]|uniref:Uncharacterized protein n=1 Tax=Aphanomyces astaci TaxID=112090 RepID=W4G320_APHAT|nr:hypothetical protein H257_11772 [Aphanomyces astaci]ETV73671.1 hypothetical protein H257_11772 [Aphanomyces astaci]KAF0747474.1 hypothetical protein AaE_007713 [Aphanomyces astaci]RHY07803.1 hypothetical protein DYB36_002534 [Aphanomyces astaci]RHY18256.1 hypothetical protein DYB25_001172 [Aphanomyces astaci]RHY84704.1 hypothetical protein DYB35_006858 [Aphanomyces astaci]|eukprot:XP_009837097.1 hypothetical protein H257_11772 [Aphanomyces astaci]